MDKAVTKRMLAFSLITLGIVFLMILIQQLTTRKIYFLKDGMPLAFGTVEDVATGIFTLDAEGMLDCRKTIGDNEQMIYILRDSQGNNVINSALTFPRFGVLILDFCDDNNKIISTRIPFEGIGIKEQSVQYSSATSYQNEMGKAGNPNPNNEFEIQASNYCMTKAEALKTADEYAVQKMSAYKNFDLNSYPDRSAEFRDGRWEVFYMGDRFPGDHFTVYVDDSTGECEFVGGM